MSSLEIHPRPLFTGLAVDSPTEDVVPMSKAIIKIQAFPVPSSTCHTFVLPFRILGTFTSDLTGRPHSWDRDKSASDGTITTSTKWQYITSYSTQTPYRASALRLGRYERNLKSDMRRATVNDMRSTVWGLNRHVDIRQGFPLLVS
jgi:hypothetical protein